MTDTTGALATEDVAEHVSTLPLSGVEPAATQDGGSESPVPMEDALAKSSQPAVETPEEAVQPDGAETGTEANQDSGVS